MTTGPSGFPRPFAKFMLGLERDPVETDVVCFLLGVYGRPFWWFRVGAAPLVVT